MIFTYKYEEVVETRSTVFVSCAHNEFLNTLCNYGILGFVSFYMFWYFVIFDKKKKILYLIECVYVRLFVT